MAISITVYGRPDRVCQKCRATKRWLTKHGIPFRYVNVDADPASDAFVRELGALEVPVVVVLDGPAGEEWWAGYSVTKLEALAEGLALDDSA